MEQYIVSARKYRPDSFESLIGQDNIARTLKNSILRGQLAHAYLFCGPRGVGKTSAARIFAKTINCSNPGADMEPCGECESCRSFQEGRSYCIHELDAASNNGVEDIKALMDKVQIPPQVGRYSVYIIDEVHMLSQSAFNAFLKTLEEPPAHAIFILATTEKHKILPTILSRCQTYDFNRIGVQDIVRNLRDIARKENITIDDESMHVIARKADGAMRDALTIFDQTVAFCGTDIHYADVIRNLNVLDSEYNFKLTDAFLAGDYATALLTYDEILSKGFNALHFISSVGSHLRDLLVSRTGGLEALLDMPDSLRARYKEQAGRCSVKFIYDALAAISQCEAGYRASTNQRLHIEFTLMKLCFINTAPSGAVAPAVKAFDGGSAPITSPGAAPAQSPAAAAEPKPVAKPVGDRAAGMTHNAVGCADPTASGPPSYSAEGGMGSVGHTGVAVAEQKPEPKPVAAPAKPEPEAVELVAEPEPVEMPAPKPEPKPEPKAAATRAARRPAKKASSLSFSALLEDEDDMVVAPVEEVAADVVEALPGMDSVEVKWKELAAQQSRQPRLANALANAKLQIVPGEGYETVQFSVTNEAQKKWIEEKILRELEGSFQQLLDCRKVRLEPVVIAEAEEEKKVYMPAEKARDLMDQNEEVRNLVVELALDIK